jgi:hypothetical protein
LGFALRDRRHRASLPAVDGLSPGQRQVITPVVTQALRAATDLVNLTEIVRLAYRFNLPVDPAVLRTATARAVRTPGDIEAVYRAMPVDLQAALLDGVVAGLQGAERRLVRDALTPAVCDLLVDRDWTHSPAVGWHVLVSHGRRHPARRVGMTEVLTSLADSDRISAVNLDTGVGEIWKQPPPTVGDCLRLIGPAGVLSDNSARRAGVLDLTRRAFAAVGADLRSADAVRVADRVLDVLGHRAAHPAAADAAAVLALQEMTTGKLRVGCVQLDQVRARATERVAKAVTTHACNEFIKADPQTQAVVLVALPPRSSLGADLVNTLMKTRVGALDLVELAAWLQQQGRPYDAITARAMRLMRHQFQAAELRTRLVSRNRTLAKPFDALLARARTGFLARIIHRNGRG